MRSAAFAVCLSVFLAVAAGAAGASKPSLGLVGKRPVSVRGTSFQPAERVGVTLAAGGMRFKRTVRASDAGSFTARFRVSLSACKPFTVQAFGSLGSRARLLPKVQPACIPAYNP
jgi:hypothetical protein